MKKMNIELEDEEDGSGHACTKCLQSLKMKKKEMNINVQNA